jgi:hypothetical protein
LAGRSLADVFALAALGAEEPGNAANAAVTAPSGFVIPASVEGVRAVEDHDFAALDITGGKPPC